MSVFSLTLKLSGFLKGSADYGIIAARAERGVINLLHARIKRLASWGSASGADEQIGKS